MPTTGAEPNGADIVRMLARSPACRRTYWAFWVFLATSALTLFVAAIYGSQFMQTLRDAQLEFGATTLGRDLETFGPFVEKVVREWPARLAAHPITWEDPLRVALLTAIAGLLFYWTRQSPHGLSLRSSDRFSQKVHDATAQQLEEFGFFEDIVRADPELGFAQASAYGRRLFLPVHVAVRTLTQRRPEPDPLRFLLAHEMLHATGRDNVLYSQISAFIFLMLTGALVFIVTPVVATTLIALPQSLALFLGPFGAIPLVLLLCALELLAIVAAGWLLISGYAGVREYFADRAGHLVAGAAGYPYEDDAGAYSAVNNWTFSVSPKERFAHVKGHCSRAGVMLAGMLGTWALLRTILLIVAPKSVAGPVWAYDFIALFSTFVVWRQLRPSAPLSIGSRLAWLNLAIAALTMIFLLGGFAGMVLLLIGRVPGLGFWSMSYQWPLIFVFVFAITVAIRTTLARHRNPDSAALHLSGLAGASKTIWLLLASLPSIAFGTVFAGFSLHLTANAALVAIKPLFSEETWLAFPVGVVSMALGAMPVALFARNISHPTCKSIAGEIAIYSGAATFSLYGLYAYLDAFFRPEPSLPANLSFISDFFIEALLNPPPGAGTWTAASFLATVIFSTLTWWPRGVLLGLITNGRCKPNG